MVSAQSVPSMPEENLQPLPLNENENDDAESLFGEG